MTKSSVFTAPCTTYIARYCYGKSSVRPSVRPSATLMYRGRIGWFNSKAVTRVSSLGLRSSKPQRRQSIPRGTPSKLGCNRGGMPFSAENLQYLSISETGQDGTKATLKTNKSRIRAFDWCQNQWHWTRAITHSVSKYMRFRSSPRKIEWR